MSQNGARRASPKRTTQNSDARCVTVSGRQNCPFLGYPKMGHKLGPFLHFARALSCKPVACFQTRVPRRAACPTRAGAASVCAAKSSAPRACARALPVSAKAEAAQRSGATCYPFPCHQVNETENALLYGGECCNLQGACARHGQATAESETQSLKNWGRARHGAARENTNRPARRDMGRQALGRLHAVAF